MLSAAARSTLVRYEAEKLNNQCPHGYVSCTTEIPVLRLSYMAGRQRLPRTGSSDRLRRPRQCADLIHFASGRIRRLRARSGFIGLPGGEIRLRGGPSAWKTMTRQRPLGPRLGATDLSVVAGHSSEQVGRRRARLDRQWPLQLRDPEPPEQLAAAAPAAGARALIPQVSRRRRHGQPRKRAARGVHVPQ
jgi:hypothetical protein